MHWTDARKDNLKHIISTNVNHFEKANVINHATAFWWKAQVNINENSEKGWPSNNKTNEKLAAAVIAISYDLKSAIKEKPVNFLHFSNLAYGRGFDVGGLIKTAKSSVRVFDQNDLKYDEEPFGKVVSYYSNWSRKPNMVLLTWTQTVSRGELC